MDPRIDPLPNKTRACWILFILLFFSYGYCHQRKFDGATPASRLNVLHSLYQQKSLIIDAYHTNTTDKALYNGHYYSDKAPGTVALAFIPFAISATFLQWSDISLDSERGWLITSWIACVGSISVIAAIGGVALFAWLCRFVHPRCALTTTLALFLGAAPLPYSTFMFSHALVIGLIAITLWALRLAVETRACMAIVPIEGPRRSIIAGFCSGYAVASEFSAGLIVAAICVWVIAIKRQHRIFFFAALVFALLLIPIYSWLCFQNVATIAYDFHATFPQMHEGAYAIKLPDLVVASKLLFSPSRGLFYWTPFALVAIIGFRRLFDRTPAAFSLCFAPTVLQIAVISGRAWDWQAGFTVGPRLLSPVFPLLALPCAIGAQLLPKTGLVLAVYSILITSLATLVDASPRYHIYNPLAELHIPLLLLGSISWNWGVLLGLTPTLSVVAFYLMISAFISRLWRYVSVYEDRPPKRQ